MISTFFKTAKCFSPCAWAIVGSIVLFACGARDALAQPRGLNPGFLEHQAVTPPLLFHEGWRVQPSHNDVLSADADQLLSRESRTAALNDVRRRITPQSGTDPDLEIRLYGPDARDILVVTHHGIHDIWNGMATSPVAVMLRDKDAYLDLTGLAKIRWMTRTEDLHVLHPVVRLADGTLLVSSQSFSSPQRPMMGSTAFSGDFEVSEVTFDDQRWFQLDPVRLVTVQEVGNPDLSRVDEIGFVDLMPGGGHRFAGCSNVSWIEVYAVSHKR